MIGKFELNSQKEGWGEAGHLAETIAAENGFTVFKKDHFYKSGEYPNYENFEFWKSEYNVVRIVHGNGRHWERKRWEAT